MRGVRNGQYIISAIFLSIAIVAGILFFQLSDTEEIRDRIRLNRKTISNIDSYDRFYQQKQPGIWRKIDLLMAGELGLFDIFSLLYQKKNNVLWYYKETLRG